MKIFTCDICKVVVENESQLKELKPELASDTVKHTCHDCMDEIDNVYRRFHEVLMASKKTWLQHFLARLIKQKTEN